VIRVGGHDGGHDLGASRQIGLGPFGGANVKRKLPPSCPCADYIRPMGSTITKSRPAANGPVTPQVGGKFLILSPWSVR